MDPDGRLFALSNDEKTRSAQLDFIKNGLGAAGKYITAVQQKGQWMIGLVDTTRSQFAKMGVAAHGMAYLMGSANTFKLSLGASLATDLGGGGAYWGFNRTIYLNPRNFPASGGGVTLSAQEAFVHEMGHALTEILPAAGDRLGEISRPASGPKLPASEGISMALENAYRREGGEDPRQYYARPGDYVDPGPLGPVFP